jgi:hypothetical protein
MSRAFPIGLALLFGMILVVAFPPLAGQDEVYHWQRVVQISEGHLLADTLGPNAYGGPIDANAYAYDLWFLKKFQDHQEIDIGEA